MKLKESPHKDLSAKLLCVWVCVGVCCVFVCSGTCYILRTKIVILLIKSGPFWEVRMFWLVLQKSRPVLKLALKLGLT